MKKKKGEMNKDKVKNVIIFTNKLVYLHFRDFQCVYVPELRKFLLVILSAKQQLKKIEQI